MPVVELRGGVPVGLWMGLPIAKVFGLCVAGNMVPIPLILLALRSDFVQKALKPFLDRARAKVGGARPWSCNLRYWWQRMVALTWWIWMSEQVANFACAM
jgi:Putative small multi-drug export protein